MALDAGSCRIVLGDPALTAAQNQNTEGSSRCCGRSNSDARGLEGMPFGAMPVVQHHARRTAAEWRDDQEAAIVIEARLARSGFDQLDINAEVFVQARQQFGMFDQLMQSAQSRRIGLLREISLRREFARRVRRAARVADDL
jgi:hypothetical protein